MGVTINTTLIMPNTYKGLWGTSFYLVITRFDLKDFTVNLLKGADFMIDIHCHIIHGVDDGPATIDESIKMAYKAAENDIRIIIATPHYKNNREFLTKVDENLNELRSRISGLGIRILRGAEVRIDPFLPELITQSSNLLIEGSNNILVELPFDIVPIFSKQTLYNIQLRGADPIIAHAERNISFQRNFKILQRIIQDNIPIQVDARSITGSNGRKAKQLSIFLLKNDLIDFIASDAHRARDYDEYTKAYNIVCRYKGRSAADILFGKNPESILERAIY